MFVEGSNATWSTVPGGVIVDSTYAPWPGFWSFASRTIGAFPPAAT